MKIRSFLDWICGWARRSPAAFLIHLSLLLIVSGALCTFFTGTHGTIELHRDVAENIGINNDGKTVIAMPFTFTLRECATDYYPASTAPKGYRCNLTVTMPGSQAYNTCISMERMLKVGAYRFTLVSMDSDSATFTINHDPIGISVTYSGYALLFLSIVAFFFSKHTGLRLLMRMMLRPNHAVSIVATALLSFAIPAKAGTQNVSATVPENVARTFGKIYVYWDDRPAPMQTLSRALLSQIYGSDSYKGLSADQVTLGWLLYYDKWKHEPIIKVKNKKIPDLIGVSGGYDALSDFFDVRGYKLQPLLEEKSSDTELHKIDQNVQLLASLSTGSLMRIFPYLSANNRMEWLSWTDYKPSQMQMEQWKFISTAMGRVARDIAMSAPEKARNELIAIRTYQLNTSATEGIPLSQVKFRAEIFYNKAASPKWPAIALMAIALATFACFVCKRFVGMARIVTNATILTAMAWLAALIILRWIIAAHWPMTNGPESMELMAFMSLLAGMACGKRNAEVSAMAIMVAGLALMVAHMSGNAHVISPLLPVLNSPLLSVHVFVIMWAYALLGIILLISLTVLASKESRVSTLHECHLSQLSLIMLYPAVFLLAAGIFIGAIWANQSWGRYWGWDPKETWALITMLVYSVPLHWQKLKWTRRSAPLAIYLSLAFVSVLITYFGVNFFLGGLHSYAS